MVSIKLVHRQKRRTVMVFETQRMQMPGAASGRSERRATLFREDAAAVVQRYALGLAWALSPKRIRGVPNILRLCFDELLAPDYSLPDPTRAFDNPPGLAGIVHDLSVPTLVTAYRRGLYPFAHIGPLKWWSPPKRSVLFFNEAHLSKRLRRQMRQNHYTVTFDRNFEGVVAACAGEREGRWHLTWITPKIMRAYTDLHDAGYAHSFEVWNQRGELTGGGYGVGVGGAFATESQFSREPNTSKIGFAVLNWHLAHWGFAFNDGKLMTPTCHDMGFRDIARSEFLSLLAVALRQKDKLARWQTEVDLATVADWRPR
jgi:leucyl/phenylalanyl-tRNA--protein transferase